MHSFTSRTLTAVSVVLTFTALAVAKDKPKPKDQPKALSPLEQYIQEAHRHALTITTSPSSLWSPAARFNDLAADTRAARVDDIVMIVVAEQTSAVVDGTTKTSRASTAKASVTALGTQLKAASALTNLANASGNTSLDGEGTTSRDTTLNTTVAARVVDVLPNGNLVVEAVKTLVINAENQVVTVRGVVRPVDLAVDNSVSADRLADLEVKVNGKGVINDSVHRPNFLYRFLLGLLPF